MAESDIVKEFLVESYENLDHLDRELVRLEQHPGDPAALAGVFRTIHTIKGTCGFLGFAKLEKVAHVGENLLTLLRDGQLVLNPEMTTSLLGMVDAVREMLGAIEASGEEGDRDYSVLIQHLQGLSQGSAPGQGEGPKENQRELQREEPKKEQELAAGERTAHGIPEAPPKASEHPESQVSGTEVAKAASMTEETNDASTQAKVAKAKVDARAPAGDEATIRVRVTQLDRLMNLVGELVLARNRIQQWVAKEDDSSLVGTSQRLNLITTELQEGVMKTRLQPIGYIWSKFPRTVRDVALHCGKQVRIEMEGQDTEIDKTIIEAIKDPLTHLVRNAVDHGIEAPAERSAAGKRAEGRLLLRAFHEGGQVNIEISDDGSGLDPEKIKHKAVQKGIVSLDQAARMSERELSNLIFLPGFSTAASVTNVSGRGVGMDVVKTNIEKIGGTVDVQSRPGQGTTVRMKIPLTLAIIPALIVTCAGTRYAIPQVNLLELVRLEGGQAQQGIENLHGTPVYRLRGQLLPLVHLREALGVPAAAITERDRSSGQMDEPPSANIVVLLADDRQFGLVVDEINDAEEIVVKPLSKQLKNINAYAGATIMGDGRISLILDVLGLAQRANVIGEVRERPQGDAEGRAGAAAESTQLRRAMLLLESGDHGRMAMDLSLVARLEEFSSEALEQAGDQLSVQYRGQIMPLVRIEDILHPGRAPLLKAAPADASDGGARPLQVVVYSSGGQSIGLVIDRILDIVNESFLVQSHTRTNGVLGTAVIQKRITEVLDVPGLLAAAALEAGRDAVLA